MRASEAYPVGARIEIPPHLDAWMAGSRYGTVSKVAGTVVHVRLDRPLRFPQTTGPARVVRVVRVQAGDFHAWREPAERPVFTP